MRFRPALFAFALVLLSTANVDSQRVKICEPKTFFMDDCNRCRCSDDGFEKSCTRIMCVKNLGSDAGRTKIDFIVDDTCVPGERFGVPCHSCVCTEAKMKSEALCCNTCTRDYPDGTSSDSTAAKIFQRFYYY